MDNTVPPPVPGYSLLHRLGSGRTATVWLAQDDANGQSVALKIFDSHDPRIAYCARTEAHMMRRIGGHSHILPLLDSTHTVDGRIVLAYAYASGGSLRDLIEKGNITPVQVARIGLDVAEALAYVHRLGIVHRDIKPGNILLDANGDPLFMDFGIAAEAYDHSSTGHSRRWAAPEILDGRGGDERADIYALAATLSALLDSANCDNSVSESMQKDTKSNAHNSLEMMLRRALQAATHPDPDLRTPSAQVFAEQLRCLIELAGERSPAQPRAAASPTAESTFRRTSHVPDAFHPHPRRRLIVIIATLCCATLLAAGSLTVLRSCQTSPSETPPSTGPSFHDKPELSR